jgi:hypothetical protein
MKLHNPYLIHKVQKPRMKRSFITPVSMHAIYEQAKKLVATDGVFGSTLESRIYYAMLALGWKPNQIEAQVDIFGGRARKNGQVVDFVLYTPTPLPIRAQGEHWHQDAGLELIHQLQIHWAYGVDPIDIWGRDAKTIEQAKMTVLQKIGRPL